MKIFNTFAALLAAVNLIGCQTAKVTPVPDPLAVIYPPGYTPPAAVRIVRSPRATQPVKLVSPVAVKVPAIKLRLSLATFDVPMFCDPYPNPFSITGLILYAGNQSGKYAQSQFVVPQTNTFTFTGLDSGLGWFFAATSFATNPVPIVNCDTNADTGEVNCTTNYVTQSDFSNEAFTMPPTAMALGTQTNGSMFAYIFYGVTNVTYVIQAGPSPTAMTNLPGTFVGTNGPIVYTEPMVDPQRYYRWTNAPSQ